MARQGYDLQLTRYDERGWRATFYTTRMQHSPTSATGTGWERTPWHVTAASGVRGAQGRPTFYTTGMEHSPTSATGTWWERTPWRATQRAAWEALKKAEPN
jgi:hypothetical protein